MPDLLALIYALLVAVGWPLYDYFIDWPRFMRDLERDPHGARRREYLSAILLQWLLAGVAVSLRLRANPSWPAPALHLPSGWRLWAAAGFLLLFVGVQNLNILKASRSERTRAYIRAHMTQAQPLLPSTTEELVGFLGLSVTAGLCEEFLFRGYLIWVLAPYLGWWGAAAFSLLSFGVVHAYQGRKGVIQATVFGALLTLIVAVTGSLVPAMIFHGVLDAGSGVMAWISLREPHAPVANSLPQS
jgi:uncharacterized protein